MAEKFYMIDNRKIASYAYIYKVEEFFRQYNDNFFGAILNNFWNTEHKVPSTSYSVDDTIFLNKNITDLMFFDENRFTIPFVKFALTYHSNFKNRDDNLISTYARYITMLRDDIKNATYNQLLIAHTKFAEYKKYFMNKYLSQDCSNIIDPNYVDNLAFAYIKRLEEIFGVNKDNIEFDKNLYDEIFASEDLDIMFIEFERKIVCKVNGMKNQNTAYNPIKIDKYYCKINYDEIVNLDEKTLKLAHQKLDIFLKDNENIFEEFVDERRFGSYNIWTNR